MATETSARRARGFNGIRYIIPVFAAIGSTDETSVAEPDGVRYLVVMR